MAHFMEPYNEWKDTARLEIEEKIKSNEQFRQNLANVLDKVYNKNQRIDGLETNERNAVMTIFGLTEESIRDNDTAKQNLYTFISTLNEGLSPKKRIIIAPNNNNSNSNNFIDGEDEGNVFGHMFYEPDYGGSKMRKRKSKRRKTNKKSKRKSIKTRRRFNRKYGH